jgi:hypothetical protein
LHQHARANTRKEAVAYPAAVLLLESEDRQETAGLAALPGTHALALPSLPLLHGLRLDVLLLLLALDLFIVTSVNVSQNPVG